MSGYRRFVAYVYEYRKGKKEGNCGFVKVEVRDQRCTMEIHLHCLGLTPRVECKIYGFVRKEGLMNGILLGCCETEEDTASCLIETDSLNMGGSGISLGRMGGMVILTETGGFFGTEWDDQPIRPSDFRELKITEKKKPSAEASMPQQTETQGGIEEIPQNETASEETFQEIQEQTQQEIISVPEVLPETETPGTEITETETPDTGTPGTETPEVETSETETPEVETPETETLEAEAAPEEEDSEEKLPQESGQRPQRPKPAPAFGENFTPFKDSDLVQCRKIQPKDFAYFPRRESALRNNRFLLYGYYNFGHLLLCKRADGQYILGVPGVYDQQERFMANMFGFPFFKESPYIELPKGKGGYWYRLINAPDFH